MTALVDAYDALLVDLDGTVYAGKEAIPGAREALAGQAALYVTNNASRTPGAVSAQLRDLGFAATDESVVTSAQAGASLLATLVPAGARVLVVGAPALRDEVVARGLTLVDSFDDAPQGVIQGHSPATGWAQLSEAVLSIRAGAVWVACNVDATLPSERGLLAGNGAMVAAVERATGQVPVVAGKPAAPLMHDAIARADASQPLVIGDRLDTDIEAGATVGIDSLLVLTGVNTVDDVIAAPDRRQPTFVAPSLGALHLPADAARPGPRPGWQADLAGRQLVLRAAPGADPADAMYVAIAAAREVPESERADLRVTLPADRPRPWR